jgi:hypothetical protein
MGLRAQDGQSTQRPVTPEPHQPHKHSFKLGMFQRIHDFFSRDDDATESPVHSPDEVSWPDQPPPDSKRDWAGRKVGVGLPRQATFRRQNSEKRDRLCPIEPCTAERRAVSHSRMASSSLPRPRSNSTPIPTPQARTSAPAVANTTKADSFTNEPEQLVPIIDSSLTQTTDDQDFAGADRPPRPPSITSSITSREERYAPLDDKAQINAELDTRWILNLSMHFRDKSDREKFFVTYAETPTKWRRVTVSCDYRNAEPGSLEMDLKELQFQRDKSMQIYESIRDSLPEIQFYDTVTNLKLETSDGRLHVHVTEDVNEIIPYPPRATVNHILRNDEYRPQEISESELVFDSHLSGFVYKVRHNERVYIKKEIPGPDTVDEFLYEINALHALHDSENVIRLEALVMDDTQQLVKGLLISYAEQGAIVDLLYDHKGKIPWEERLRWARDAVVGLSEIHEEGYVQGDFTLSNIVVDSKGSAKIIDINRRGCPVGWEPPEIATKIASHQRISMYIGEKSDLYQLGMTLWGLAADDDEPERHDPPLHVDDLPTEIPEWYKDIVEICLSRRPRDRLPAKHLVRMWRQSANTQPRRTSPSPPRPDIRGEKRYIDPAHAVERDDIEEFNRNHQHYELPYSPESSRYDDTFTYPRSSNYDRASEFSAFERPRGRSGPTNVEHLSRQERHHWSSENVNNTSANDADAQIVSISPRLEPQYEEIDFDGKPFLIARNTFSDEELKILEHKPSLSKLLSDPVTEDATMATGSGLARSRPPLPSQTSATSSSTPRNSQAILNSGAFSLPRDGDRLDNSSDIAGGHKSQESSHLRSLFDVGDQHSPRPPPSLSNADSGFHEPADSTDDYYPEEISRQPVKVMDDSDHIGHKAIDKSSDYEAGPTSAAQPEDLAVTTSVPFDPPRLMRSDTTIKVGLPDTTEISPITPQLEYTLATEAISPTTVAPVASETTQVKTSVPEQELVESG